LKKRILVVDDEPDIVKVILFRLRKIECEAVVAIDGQEALDKIQQSKPDLILLDLLLPVMSGEEVCKRIKANDELRNIPVILVTASTIGDLGEIAREIKADDYLTKPFDTDELIAKVKSFIGS